MKTTCSFTFIVFFLQKDEHKGVPITHPLFNRLIELSPLGGQLPYQRQGAFQELWGEQVPRPIHPC